MSAEESNLQSPEPETPVVNPGNYSPVSVYMNGNTLGTIFLAILSVLLLIGWMRTETHYYSLLKRQG
jgi:hypothetical protein